ncbi:DNA cytosine methyltransferase [Microbulbifer agarilyticus]|uniref:DNA cytosine methyltransferase n=1 Tax=Microbulbifer agarilyticus TaxID=260552 RepID=UPI001CD5DAE2|nr:DNA cytosine methyltransferase [Microbulbifer agarilyticus]MCA0893288.1 DNA cytosine methyltransferase [Microbulbifer agarilyticus]
MNHIELFAGCGGLSLGLETAGFDLLVANELSPMASETFAYNHLGADLETQSNCENVYWISSQFERDKISLRLRENPVLATGLSPDHTSDLKNKLPNEKLKRSLLVGSIVDINTLLEEKRWFRIALKSGLGTGDVDLVSGGPPCQSFSLAGLRDHTHHRNQLPWEFAKFVENVKPKIALLENVSGILRPFKIEGEKFYAWYEVAKAFAKVGYIPLCLHVNAKYSGAAQNRPRFIMIAIRKDVLSSIKKSIAKDDPIRKIFEPSELLFKAVRNGDPEYGAVQDFKCWDIEKDKSIFSNSLLKSLLSHPTEDTFVSVKDAIDDLHRFGEDESSYVNEINSLFSPHEGLEEILPINKENNHEERTNNNRVRARFRLYQIMSILDKSQVKEIYEFLKTKGQSNISNSCLAELGKHWMLDVNGKLLSKPTATRIKGILKDLHTKKQTQKALIASLPAPAALSIPDDACHYYVDDKNQSTDTIRTLTVREMARIQSFPDWYRIRSKVTTGGQMRKFEVPQYTQIGNAVPPLLGFALGKVCRELLKATDGK